MSAQSDPIKWLSLELALGTNMGIGGFVDLEVWLQAPYEPQGTLRGNLSIPLHLAWRLNTIA